MRLRIVVAAPLLLAVLTAAEASAALSCRIGYASPRSYDRGIALRVGVAVADFDGDGLPDIASLHRYGNDGTPNRTGTLMLNRGHDVFDQRPIIAAGDFGTIQAGLLDGDAFPDLVLGGSTPLTILYSNGDGTFRNGATVDIRNVTSIAFGQFDGKNGVDIAVAQSSPAVVSILLSNADGTYSFSSSFPLSAAGTAVVAADFDRDGRVDLAVADRVNISTFFGNGDGSFAIGPKLSSFSVSALAVGDIDHDGRPDIIAGGQSEVTIFVYAGARQFRLNGINGLSGDTQTQTISLTDIDGDPNLDVVAVGGGDIAVLRGSPGGRLLPPVVYVGGAAAVAGAVGDFDRDGLTDVVVSNLMSADVSVLRNLGAGQLDAMRKLEGGTGAIGFATADVNLDFHPDLIVANQISNDMIVYRGNGVGGFDTPSGYPLGFPPKSIRTGDIDGDELTDVALLSQDGKSVGILFGERDGTFRDLTILSFAQPLCCIELAQMNNDSFADLVYAEAQGSVGVRLSLGLRTAPIFGTATTYPIAGDSTAMAVGDLNLDHHPDVVVGTTLGLFTFNGSSTGALSASALIDVKNASSLAIGLLDDDNIPDIVAGAKDVVILMGDGSGTFQSQLHLAVPTPTVTAVTLADLDGDGRTDIAASNFSISSAEHFVSVYLNHGDVSGFEALPAIQSETQPGTILAADFTDDKTPDLVISAAGKALFARARCAPPAVTIAGPRNAVPGQPITLVANAVAGAARNANFAFIVDGNFAGAAPVDLLEPGIARLSVTLPAGTHTIRAIVRYPEGESATSDEVTLVVSAAGKRRAVRH
jgi:VCBS repeat protein